MFIIPSFTFFIDELKTSLDEKSSQLQALVAEVSASELQSLSSYVDKLSTLIVTEKENINSYKDLIVNYLKEDALKEYFHSNVNIKTFDILLKEKVQEEKANRQSGNQ